MEREQLTGDEPSEAERLAAASVLLDRNAEAIFKLNGLAMLRRRSGAGGSVALTPDEACLLAEAQRCLEDVARLLPPKCLMPPAAAKRLRQQLQGHGAAAEGEGDAKRQQLVEERLPGQRQQLAEQQQPSQQLFPGASVPTAGGSALRPGPTSHPQPPAPVMAPQAPAEAAAAMQGAPSLAHSGPLGGPSAAGLAVAPSMPGWPDAGPAAAPSLAPQQAALQPAATALGGQPGPPGHPSPMLVEPVAKEEMWLLSQAYGSMTVEQKAKLAAQPPEVRQFVLRERMRKTKEQLDLLQRQRAGTTAAGLPAQPLHPTPEAWRGNPAGGGAPDMVPQQQQPGLAPAEQWAAGGAALPGAAGQQALMHAQHAQQQLLARGPLPAAMLDPGSAGAPMGHSPQPAAVLPGMVPQPLPPQLYSQQQQQQQVVLPGSMPGAAPPAAQLAAAPGVAAGGSARPPAAPFLAMSEADRMEHLRQLKRRQNDWLEQQRRAAAMLSESISG